MAKITKNNPYGLTATQRKKIVEIAKDVLLQIKHSDVYTGSGYLSINENDMQNLKGSWQEYFSKPKNLKKCTICAKGALFISKIRLYNKFSLDMKKLGNKCVDYENHNIRKEVCDLSSSQDLYTAGDLEKIFPEELWDKIEEVFENSEYFNETRKMREDKNILKYICNNLIKNNGDLVVTVHEYHQSIISGRWSEIGW